VRGLEAFYKKLEAEGVAFDAPFRDVPRIGLLKVSTPYSEGRILRA
jgi:hypothetical protein